MDWTPAPHRNDVLPHPLRRVFVRDLVLPCLIGVHRHERDAKQRVRINLDLAVIENDQPVDDKLANVLCYERLTARVRDVVMAGHVNLVETLAERIAAVCLDYDDVVSAQVRVEKLDVFADAASVGIEIERHSPMGRAKR
ncbi:MAG: dihydroneopterin aldolase [Rhodospirillales bacterium]